MEENYEVTYSCGCKHELTNIKGMHEATGKQTPCDIHKAV